MNILYNQKFCDAAKAIFKGKLIALNVFLLEKKERQKQRLKHTDKEIFLKSKF